MVCTHCGASLPVEIAQHGGSCPYCDAAVVRAPRVIERVVERVIERVVVVAPAGEVLSQLQCPRCATGLRPSSGNGKTLHGCASCGGVFIDRENLARFGGADHEVEAHARSVIGAIGSAQLLGRAPDRRARISCPVGGEPFVRKTIRFTQTDVDVCEAHGVWLDGGEIRHYLRPPTDDPHRDLTAEELETAGLDGGSQEGFFANVKRLLFGG